MMNDLYNLISYLAGWPLWALGIIIVWGVSAPLVMMCYWLAQEMPEGHDWE